MDCFGAQNVFIYEKPLICHVLYIKGALVIFLSSEVLRYVYTYIVTAFYINAVLCIY